MPRTTSSQRRLPRNFHRTFIPERQYIHALLRYAAADKGGTYQEISGETGIPTGGSSGKVPATLDYCRGMGLVQLRDSSPSSAKHPVLTPLGRIIFLEDPFLREPLTQWVVHLNLCSSLSGADTWFYVFHARARDLGSRFQRDALESLLTLIYGTANRNLIGPLVRTYEDDAALLGCGALSTEDSTIVRSAAPIREEFVFAYGAWMLNLAALHFPRQRQITATELDSRGGWRTIPAWGVSEGQQALEMIERKKLVQVDRQMNPWILHPLADASEIWPVMFKALI